MTKLDGAKVLDNGPLFAWRPATSADVPNRPERPDGRPERPDVRNADSPNSPMDSGRPAPSGLPDVRSEFTNDFGPSGHHPFRGNDERLAGGPPMGPPLRFTSRQEDGPRGPGSPTVPSSGRPDQNTTPGPNLAAPSRPELRPYQRAALDAVRTEFAKGTRTTLLELPTGCGKTVCFAELGRIEITLGHRVLVVAHREELLEQAQQKFADLGVWAAIEQGDRRAGSAPVVIASVQTMHARRLAQFAPDAFDVVIIDEGHHAAAASYRGIVDRFPKARVLLVTATPDRADGKALGKICDTVAYRYELRQAIADKWLVPLVARRVVVADIDLSKVSTRAGDFATDELAAVFGEERALHGVAIPLLKLSGARRTIAFAVDVENAHQLAAVLNRYQAGVARAVDGKMGRDERKRLLRDFRAGEFRILVNCALFTEGFDEPSVACVAIARPTKSRALHCQMLGRGTRLFAGKRDCLVLDFVGNTGRHSLVGPADALASNDLDAELRSEIETLLAGESDRDVGEVIALAKEQLASRKRSVALLAVADYRTKEVDPFLAKFMRGPAGDPNGPAATEAQIARLKRDGLEKLPANLTAVEAARWISACDARSRLGLATLKMARALERANFDTEGMRFERAQYLIARLRAANFKHPLLSSEPEYRKGWRKRA